LLTQDFIKTLNSWTKANNIKLINALKFIDAKLENIDLGWLYKAAGIEKNSLLSRPAP